MRTIITTAAAVALLCATSAAAAQSRWSAELSTEAAFATSEVAGEDLDTGFGFGATVRYRFLPHLAAYGGWEWHHFQTSEAVDAGGEVDLEDNGYTFGLRFEHPLFRSLSGWLRVGGIGNHIELESADGDRLYDSGHGLGFEAGGGLTIPIGERLGLTPGVRYRSLSRDVEIGGVRQPADLRYVTTGLGVAIQF